MKDDIPFFAIGNDKLAGKPEAGKYALCPHCKKRRVIRYGKVNGEPSRLLGWVKCGKELYLVVFGGKVL